MIQFMQAEIVAGTVWQSIKNKHLDQRVLVKRVNARTVTVVLHGARQGDDSRRFSIPIEQFLRMNQQVGNRRVGG